MEIGIFNPFQKVKAIDLSLPLFAASPYWPIHPPFTMRTMSGMGFLPARKSLFYYNLLLMSEHVGTHVDAPAHNLADGQDDEIGRPPHLTLDQLPLLAFSGPAVVIDWTGEEEERALLIEHLAPRKVSSVGSRIRRRCC